MKAPSHAKLTHEGKFIKVYQWDQELSNGEIKQFELAKLPGAALVLPVKDGKIGIAYQTQIFKGTYYSLFGGMIDEGEEILESAKRELKEEAGLGSDIWEHYKTFGSGTMLDDENHIFIAKDCYEIGGKHLDGGEEMIDAVWLDFEGFIELIIHQKIDGKSVNYKGKDMKLEIMTLHLQGKLSELKEKLL